MFILVILCIVMSIVQLRKALLSESLLAAISCLFWISLLLYTITENKFLVIPVAVFLALQFLGKMFPIQAHIFECKIEMLWKKGHNKEVSEFLPELLNILKCDGKDLINKLDSPNPLVRDAVIDELSSRRERKAAGKLMEMLKADDECASSIITTLGNLANKKAIPLITGYLGHSDEQVRQASLISLGQLKATESVEKIVSLLVLEEEDDILLLAINTLLLIIDVDELEGYWPKIPIRAKLLYLNSAHDDVRRSGSKKLNVFVELSERDSSEKLRKKGASISRQLCLLYHKKSYPKLFSPKDRNKAGGCNHPQDIKVKVQEPITMTFEKTGTLTFEPGNVDCSLLAQYHIESEDDDLLCFEFFTVDRLGTVWQTNLYCSTSVLLDLVMRSDDKKYYKDCSKDWQRIFEQRWIIKGTTVLDDSRNVYEFKIARDLITVYLKHQSAVFDLALETDNATYGTCLLIRTCDLREYEEWDEIPPFVVSIPLMKFLEQIVTSNDNGYYDEEENRFIQLKPSVRQQRKDKEASQESVLFTPM